MKTCLILDDYQDAARRFADWDRLADRVTVTALHETVSTSSCPRTRAGSSGWRIWPG